MRKKLTAIALMVAMAIAVSWLLHLRLSIPAPDRPTSIDYLRYEIGNHAFDIPRRYLFDGQARRGGKVAAVNLRALLPDMEGFSERTRAEFEKPGWNRKVRITLHERAYRETLQEYFDALIAANRFKRDGTVGEEFGLERLSEAFEKGRELYVGREGGAVIYIAICEIARATSSPACKALLFYSDTLYIDYAFSRTYLADWATVDAKVKALLRSFDLAARKLKQDGKN